jgi:site-specific DNA-methyltransferase (adenine-specific)
MFEEIPKLDKSCIDLIFADLPYAVSKNEWDKEIDLRKMWELFDYVLRDGAWGIFTSSGVFTGKLITSNEKWYKYTDIWVKTIASGQLNVNKMPLRKHEEIVVFRKPGKPITYNEIITSGTPYKINRDIEIQQGYGEQKKHTTENTGTRRQTSVFEIPNPRIKGGHPTQKPYELIERIIKIYSNESDMVLDPCFGSNVTGLVCENNNRDYVGIELDEGYYNLALRGI